MIEALLDDVLDRQMICEAVDEALDLLQGGGDATRHREDLERQLAVIARERDRLFIAVKSGERVSGLLEAVQALEQRQGDIESQLAAIASQTRLSVGEIGHVRDEPHTLAADWRQVLVDDPANARPIVTSLLDRGRVTFTSLAEPKRWEMRGEASIIGLFRVIAREGMASPTGFEPVFWP